MKRFTFSGLMGKPAPSRASEDKPEDDAEEDDETEAAETDDEEKSKADDKPEDGAEDGDDEDEETAKAATQRERRRWATVLASDVAASRVAVAAHLLANTDMAAKDITATLELTPAVTGRKSFKTAMDTVGNPDLKDTPEPTRPSGDAGVSDRILANHAKATGRPPAVKN